MAGEKKAEPAFTQQELTETEKLTAGFADYQTNSYMPQREVPQDEKLNEDRVGYLNRSFSIFNERLGIQLDQNTDKVPESDGVPRLFLLDENEPGKPRTLKEAGVKAGSMEFWTLAQQGKLFGYPAGSKDAVQIFVREFKSGGPKAYISRPLNDPEAADKFQLMGESEPQTIPSPKKVKAPGFFAQLLHRINSNWYKKEHEDYEKYLQACADTKAKNDQNKADYLKRVDDAKKKSVELSKKMSAGIEARYASSRTKENLDREKIGFLRGEESKKAENMQAGLDAAALSAKTQLDNFSVGLDRLPTFFGTKPAPEQKYVDGGKYKEESFARLPEMKLPEVQIGDTRVDDKLFANLAYNAMLNKDILYPRFLNTKQQIGIDDPMKAYLDEGLSQKEADELMVQSTHSFTSSDIFNPGLRASFDASYFEQFEAGRKKAEKALLAYKDGNVQPLAEIIAKAAGSVAYDAGRLAVLTDCTMSQASLACQLIYLAEKDDALLAAAKKEGLDKKTIDACQGIDLLRDLKERSLQAELDLAQANAEHKVLDQEDKEEYLHDIFKYRVAEAHIREELKVKNNKELHKQVTELNNRGELTSRFADKGKDMPKGVKPVKQAIAGEISDFHLCHKLSKPTAVLNVLRESHDNFLYQVDPEPDSLDILTDKIVKSMGLARKDTGELASMLVGGKGPSGMEIMEEQGKIMQAEEKERQRQEEHERRFNDAVILKDSRQAGKQREKPSELDQII